MRTRRALIYGSPHTQKSRCAATADKPICVWLFDPPDKGIPYLENYEGDRLKVKNWPLLKLPNGEFFSVEVEQGYSEDGVLEVQVEHYGGIEKNRHLVMSAFQQRLREIEYKELRAKQPFKTYVLDSMSFAEQASVRRAQNDNPLTGDTRQSFKLDWANTASIEMKSLVFEKLPQWRDVNVIVIAHEGEKEYQSGEILIRGIMCYGKLVKNITSAYTENYHAVTQTVSGIDEKTGFPVDHTRTILRTVRHGPFDGGTNMGVPDPCEPDWDVITRRKKSQLPEHATESQQEEA